MEIMPTFFHFKECSSTMEEAKKYILSLKGTNTVGQKSCFVFVSDHQTSGRGRFDTRKWSSPPNMSLLVTILLPPDLIGIKPALFPLYAGYILAKVLEDYAVMPKIKWPNDLLCNGKKISGILCEQLLVDEINFISCGIGLNLVQTEFAGADFLTDKNRPKFKPTSLFMETGKRVSSQEILNHILKLLLTPASINWLEDLTAYLYGINCNVEFATGLCDEARKANIIEGKYVGISSSGGILIEENSLGCKNPTVTEYSSGELVKIL